MKKQAASTRKARSDKAAAAQETERRADAYGVKPAPVQGEIRPVPPAAIMPSPWQTRAEETAEELEGLAASIRTSGMLNPLTVRKAGPDAPSGVEYELVCGHRRLAAARLAGLTLVPCVVLDMDAAAAQLANVVENLQRKDLSPVEEADGVAALTQCGKTAPEIARMLGVSERWVFRRRRLSALLPAWRKIIRERKSGQVFCERLAALPQPMQRLLLETDLAKEPDPRNIGQCLWNAGAKDVARMPWAETHPDWCGGCANAVNNLADGGEGITDAHSLRDCRFCANPACREEKTRVWVQERWAFLKKAVPPSCPPPVKVRQACQAPWDKREQPDPKHGAAYLVTDGPEAGKVWWAAPPKKETAGRSGKPETREEIPGRREELRRITAIRKLIVQGEAANAPRDPRLALILTLLIRSDWGTEDGRRPSRIDRVRAALALSDGDLAEAVAQTARRFLTIWMDNTRFLTMENYEKGALEEAEWMAETYAIAGCDIEKKIEEERAADGGN